MSSPSQIAANQANAQASTGPRTDAGKAASSKNGIKQGLFTTGDFVRPEDQPAYDQLNNELHQELAPVGLLERNLVNEIRRAMWRLYRCGEVEASMVIGLDNGEGTVFDPMECASARTEKIQRSVDRARSGAHRLLHKCTAELRRLQTERHYAQEFFFEDADLSDIGIADWRAITKAHGERTRVELRQKKLDKLDTVLNIVQRSAGFSEQAASAPPRTVQTQNAA